ncbi:MAG: baseplate J/gp47 family protein, partial [Xanthomonadales bacterium]|nr:baseplate J/gp47 family protein [Xanthomonadales bacterium]
MGQFQTRTRETILQRMVNRVVARSNLNDLNDLSDVKQTLAAAAREDDDAYFQMTNLLDLFDIFKATGDDLDQRAKEFNPKLVSRIQSRKATGEVRFSRSGTSGTVTIPIGTQVTIPAQGGQPEVVFGTTEEGTIADGFSDSNLVDVQAEEGGTSGNAEAASIVGFVSKPSGVDTVTNPSSFTNGRSREKDDDFRKRLVNQIKGLARAHVDGLETAALTAEDTGSGKRVLFANVVEDPVSRGKVTVYIDDGSGTAETTVAQVGVSVIASAVGGETVFFLPDKPIKTESGFTLYINAVPQVENTDFVLNPASGQINLLPASYPAGLTAADVVTADYTNFTGLIAVTQKIIDGDPADRANFPGYRAAGV